ncbi:hypothetical protein [Streptomyces sp. NBC_01794]|uniref:hypothetical protein n=1 Tax=Streptomyces sp. NBC_01794 TaxID=2975942 RepID=UPI003085F2F4|nr:hypothetical protein OIE54_12185 [Streptomyces sp. NBC_01794]
MSWEPTVEGVAEARANGYLKELLLEAAGITPKAPKQRQAAAPEKPCYHIRRPGAWPCGTAATGPTPAPCPECAA